MNQLSGQPAPLGPVRSGDAGIASPSIGVRPSPAVTAEQAFFHVDIKRSLQLHWRLARTVALGFVALAVLYLLVQVFVRKSWPSYVSESIVYVQPTPSKVLPAQGGLPRWPYDTNTYETYILQQMMNVSRDDVLIGAVHKLRGFEKPGESDQAAAQRLVQSLEVTRAGSAYQFSIVARARDPQMAAQMANAVTASYIEGASRDEHTGDKERLQMLREERERIENALTADRIEQDALNKQLGVASVSTAVPDHYDEDITQIRSELAKARTDHDVAEQKFASLDAGRGPSSAAIDAVADEMVSSDAGLVSMKTALNVRRATLISQMANLTPSHPQYKQDEEELTKINGTLEAMMKDLRAKAAARVQLQLRADLERTGGVEAQLNGQLRQLAGAASGATPKLQRSSDLAADIVRLQARYAAVDDQLHNVLLEGGAPAAAYQVAPAVAPLTRTKSGVIRNALMIVFAGLFLGVLAAVGVTRLDPRVYIASDVEQILGFAALAQLPDFAEVSAGTAEEYILRLASAIEHGRKQGNLKNCIFTGTGPGTGVSTLVTRVGAMLEAMGRPTVLVDATGAPPPVPVTGSPAREGEQGLVPVQRVSRPTALLQQMVEETETQEGSLVLTDTAPLSVSAETEYLARFVDCAIVIVESGATTRAELRAVATALERLNVGAVGFVLNRVRLEMADPAFRTSVEAVERYVQAQGSNPARRTERSSSFAPEVSGGSEMPVQSAPSRSMFEPEVAAAAAAVARFSPRTGSEPGIAPAVCLSSPRASMPGAEIARRFSLDVPGGAAIANAAATRAVRAYATETANARTSPTVAATGAESAKAAASPAIDEPVIPAAPAKGSAPFAEASRHFASPVSAEPGGPITPRVIASTVTPNQLPAVPEAPTVPAIAAETPAPANDPLRTRELAPPAAEPAADLPWWLSDAPRNTEPLRPPVLWQPAKIWTSRQRFDDAENLPVVLNGTPEPTPASAARPQPGERAPGPLETTTGKTATTAEAQNSSLEEAPGNRTSRLSGLRNLLFVLGVKNAQDGEEPSEAHSAGGSKLESRTDRESIERTALEEQQQAAWTMGGASPRLVTAPPEFLPPKPAVIEFNRGDAHAGESSTRQDRRAAADGVEILPSKRGQYKRI